MLWNIGGLLCTVLMMFHVFGKLVSGSVVLVKRHTLVSVRDYGDHGSKQFGAVTLFGRRTMGGFGDMTPVNDFGKSTENFIRVKRNFPGGRINFQKRAIIVRSKRHYAGKVSRAGKYVRGKRHYVGRVKRGREHFQKGSSKFVRGKRNYGGHKMGMNHGGIMETNGNFRPPIMAGNFKQGTQTMMNGNVENNNMGGNYVSQPDNNGGSQMVESFGQMSNGIMDNNGNHFDNMQINGQNTWNGFLQPPPFYHNDDDHTEFIIKKVTTRKKKLPEYSKLNEIEMQGPQHASLGLVPSYGQKLKPKPFASNGASSTPDENGKWNAEAPMYSMFIPLSYNMNNGGNSMHNNGGNQISHVAIQIPQVKPYAVNAMQHMMTQADFSQDQPVDNGVNEEPHVAIQLPPVKTYSMDDESMQHVAPADFINNNNVIPFSDQYQVPVPNEINSQLSMQTYPIMLMFPAANQPQQQQPYQNHNSEGSGAVGDTSQNGLKYDDVSSEDNDEDCEEDNNGWRDAMNGLSEFATSSSKREPLTANVLPLMNPNAVTVTSPAMAAEAPTQVSNNPVKYNLLFSNYNDIGSALHTALQGYDSLYKLGHYINVGV